MISVYIDKPKLMKMKNDSKALSFSVTLYDPEEGHNVITGFRLMDGFLKAPTSQNKANKQYYQIAFLAPSVAEKIYDAVAATDWVKVYEVPALKPRDAAISDMILTPLKAATVAPSLV